MFNTCKASGSSGDDEQMELPPGFRFHPTDEELITHYLSPKVLDSNFWARAIGEVDLNKVEPWDLPWMAKMGEKEWYFFCVRDRKYPTGLRTNRATQAGYWKATGKDKEIFKVKTLVGMKKTLVFYKGRAPRGEKTNWVMHEYRLEGKNSMQNLPKSARNEWVICRIFKKSAGGKKIHISGLTRTSNFGDDSRYSNLPPLLDISSCEDRTTASIAETSRVTCFSSRVEDQKARINIFDNLSPNILASSSSKASDFSTTSVIFPKPATPNSYISSQIMPFFEAFHQMDSSLMQDQSILKLLLENNVPSTKENVKTEFSQDTGMSTYMSSSVSNHEVVLRPYEDHQCFPMTSAGPVDIGCLWDY